MADTFKSSAFEYPMGSFYQSLDARIENLETLIGTGAGAVPDFSITQYKLADNAVTNRAIGDAVVGTAELTAAAIDYIVALALTKAKWRSVGVGEYYMVNTALTGVDLPPISDPDVAFVELTAGLTTGVLFNAGKLGTETVSGSSPLVLASAVVTLAGSPMIGQTIRLLNSEGRFLRPSAAPGTLQDDASQGHRHNLSATIYSASTGGIGTGTGGSNPITISDPVSDGVNGTPRIANETRPRNLGVKAYMRIK